MKLRYAAAVALMLVAAQTAVFAAGRAGGGDAAGLGGSTGSSAKGLALGLFLGEPTGISLRLGVADQQSFEGKAAWSFAGPADAAANFIFQANYLLEFPRILVIDSEDFPLYVGIGAETHLGSSSNLAIRIPGGLIYRFRSVPIEVCLELGLGMQLFPSTTLVQSGGLGLRYRF